jgi:hypothetical protein
MNLRDKKLQEYFLEAQKFNPDIKFRSAFSMYSPSISPEPISGQIELKDKFINDSVLSNGNIQFAHYTSLRNAMNILNSGSIRLYNCLNMNDPNEIKYFFDNSSMEFENEEIEKYKREHFILSGSLIEPEKEEDFNLWRLYADDCRGVAIVFEIDDKLNNWSKIYLQKVSYEKDSKSWIYDYLKFHKEFNEKNRLFENKPQLFALLATGVKNEIWSIEKEFRIVIRNPFDVNNLASKESRECNGNISKTLKHEYNNKGKLVSYVELPLHINDRQSEKINLPISNKEVDLIDYIPNLKVKKIILGPNSPFNNRGDFFDYTMWIENKLKYGIDISISKHR